jgi:hypothetical protein
MAYEWLILALMTPRSGLGAGLRVITLLPPFLTEGSDVVCTTLCRSSIEVDLSWWRRGSTRLKRYFDWTILFSVMRFSSCSKSD